MKYVSTFGALNSIEIGGHFPYLLPNKSINPTGEFRSVVFCHGFGPGGLFLALGDGGRREYADRKLGVEVMPE